MEQPKMPQEKSNRHEMGFHGVGICLHSYKGFLMGLVAMSFFSIGTVCVTILKGTVNVFLLVLIRAVVMTVLSLIVLILTNIPLWPCKRKEMVLTILSSFFGSATVCLQFYSFHIMHPANACAILYGYITFIAFFARLFLKERFGFLEAGSILVTLTGVLLIAQPPFIFGNYDPDVERSTEYLGGPLPTLVALSASVLSAMVVVIIRAIGRDNIPVLKTLFYHSLFCIPIMLSVVTLLQQWSIPSCILSRLLSFIISLAAFLGVSSMNYALSLENAVYVGLATVNEVYIIFIADVLFFGLKLEWLNLLGMVLIIGSCLAIIIKKIVAARNKEKHSKCSSSIIEERMPRNDDQGFEG